MDSTFAERFTSLLWVYNLCMCSVLYFEIIFFNCALRTLNNHLPYFSLGVQRTRQSNHCLSVDHIGEGVFQLHPRFPAKLHRPRRSIGRNQIDEGPDPTPIRILALDPAVWLRNRAAHHPATSVYETQQQYLPVGRKSYHPHSLRIFGVSSPDLAVWP